MWFTSFGLPALDIFVTASVSTQYFHNIVNSCCKQWQLMPKYYFLAIFWASLAFASKVWAYPSTLHGLTVLADFVTTL